MTKSFFRVVKPSNTVHAVKRNQIGELVGAINEYIGLRFLDGSEQYFHSDEVEAIKTERSWPVVGC